MARKPLTLDDPRRSFIKTIEEMTHRHQPWRIFRDFCEMAAITFANSVAYGPVRDKREERYLQIIGTYEPEDQRRVPFLLSCLTAALEAAGFDDILGGIFMEMDLGSHWHGQFFSPYAITSMMARQVFEPERMAGREFADIHEPACGAGGMVIAFAETMRMQGFNPQTQLYVEAVDLDPLCVYMSMIQFSLLHLPAVIMEGNSLSGERRSVWYTPAYRLGLWDHKLRRVEREREAAALLGGEDDAGDELPPAAAVTGPALGQLDMIAVDLCAVDPGKGASENVDTTRRRKRARVASVEQSDLFAEES
jgi:hypothetical protein